LLVLLFMPHPRLWSSPVIEAPKPQKISYIRGLPKQVERWVPRGAKSCFFGKFKLSTATTEYALHLYYISGSGTPHKVVYPNKYRFILDIFEVKTMSTKQPKFQRFHHLSLMHEPQQLGALVAGSPRRFAAQLLWLDPVTRKQPILKFDCWEAGEVLPVGEQVLVVFPQGLKSQAGAQSFQFGSWRASDTCGQDNTFSATDDKGLLQVESSVCVMGPDPSAPEGAESEVAHTKSITWIWDGKKFVPDKKMP
jgi:hypothetical protein